MSRPTGLLDSGVRLALALAIPVVLLALNVHLLASETVLRLEYGRAGFASAEGLDDDERLEIATMATDFVMGDVTSSELSAVRFRDERFFTTGEVEHLRDVGRLVDRLSRGAVLGALLLAGGAIAWRLGKLSRYPHAVERGGWLTIALVAGTALAVTLAWPLFFVGFHRLFFAPGTWQFAADSGLIRLFPEQLWFDTAVALASLALVEAAVVIVVSRRLR